MGSGRGSWVRLPTPTTNGVAQGLSKIWRREHPTLIRTSMAVAAGLGLTFAPLAISSRAHAGSHRTLSDLTRTRVEVDTLVSLLAAVATHTVQAPGSQAMR